MIRNGRASRFVCNKCKWKTTRATPDRDCTKCDGKLVLTNMDNRRSANWAKHAQLDFAKMDK